ncbi:MAG: hypothetical protein AAFV28_00640 [Cyanobacteria bacterium J06635_13]
MLNLGIYTDEMWLFIGCRRSPSASAGEFRQRREGKKMSKNRSNILTPKIMMLISNRINKADGCKQITQLFHVLSPQKSKN